MKFLKNNLIFILIFAHLVSLIIMINLYFIYDIILISLGQDFLDEFVKSNKIIMEDAKAKLVLYYVEKGKPKIIAKYPIEVAFHYPHEFYKKGVSLLTKVLKTSFSACTNLSAAERCKLLVINDSGKFDFLLGERVSGKYRKIPFNFFYVIQFHYYQRLLTIDKIWPPLKIMLDQIQHAKATGSYETFLKKTFNTGGKILLKMDILENTLKIRTGVATEWTGIVEKKDKVLEYYSFNYRLKPMLVLHYNDGYQLFTMDIPMNQYYVDLFKSNHNLSYLKKLYNIDNVTKKWLYQVEWLRKYDSYDRKYRR